MIRNLVSLDAGEWHSRVISEQDVTSVPIEQNIKLILKYTNYF